MIKYIKDQTGLEKSQITDVNAAVSIHISRGFIFPSIMNDAFRV